MSLISNVGFYKAKLATTCTALFVTAVTMLPGTAFAVASVYTIEQTGSPVISGLQVSIQGQAHAHPYVGQTSDQHVSIDWDNNGTWVPATTFVPVFAGGNGNNKSFDGPWTGVHPYSTNGTKTIKVRVHHNGVTGNEGSDVATISINVVIPPPVTTGTIHVITNVINDDGGAKTASNFTTSVLGATPATHAGSTAGFDFVVPAGNYAVTSSVDAAYSQSLSANCAGSISVGATKTCTVTYNDIPPVPTCSIHANPQSITGGDAFDLVWTSTAATTASLDHSLSIANATNGTFSFPGGSLAESIFADTTYTLSVSGTGGSTTCSTTVTASTPAAGTLTVIDTVINDNGGLAVSSDFAIGISGGGATPSSASGSDTGNAVSVAAYYPYSVAQTGGPSSYATSYSAGCSGTMTVGGSATCTVTHNDIPTEGENTLSQCTDGADNDGNEAIDLNDAGCSPFIPKLTVVKFVSNSHGGTKISTDFPLFVGETSVTSGEATTFLPGTYSVSETQAAGYDASFSESCTGGSITLAVNEHKTCTITNQDKPAMLRIVKHVINDNGGTKTASDFTLTITAGNPSSSSIQGSEEGTVVSIDAGSYSVAEIADAGYTTTYSEGCSGTVGIDGSVSCIVTNDDIAPVIENEPQTPTETPAAPAPASGGGNGPISGSFGATFGQVLGASTGPDGTTGVEAPLSCSKYLTSYLKFGARNDAGQVKKLQEFLNEELGLTIPVNGIFGPATFKAVKMLQAAHTEDILAPWSKVGPALTDPTGYVYKTTQYWINKHKCQSLNEAAPVL